MWSASPSARDLEFFQLRDCGSQIESQKREARSAYKRAFEEGSAGKFHCASSDCFESKPSGLHPKFAENYKPARALQSIRRKP